MKEYEDIYPSDIQAGDDLIVTVRVKSDTRWLNGAARGGYFNGTTTGSDGYSKTFYDNAIVEVKREVKLPVEPPVNSVVVWVAHNDATRNVAYRGVLGGWYLTGSAERRTWEQLHKRFSPKNFNYTKML